MRDGTEVLLRFRRVRPESGGPSSGPQRLDSYLTISEINANMWTLFQIFADVFIPHTEPSAFKFVN